MIEREEGKMKVLAEIEGGSGWLGATNTRGLSISTPPTHMAWVEEGKCKIAALRGNFSFPRNTYCIASYLLLLLLFTLLHTTRLCVQLWRLQPHEKCYEILLTVSVTTIFAQHFFAFALGIQLWLRYSGVSVGWVRYV